jgi:hypothetical protein
MVIKNERSIPVYTYILLFITCYAIIDMKAGKEIVKEALKPITKVESEEDKELQKWEVESTGGGVGAG